MTREVIPYVLPFVILNKAELAAMRVNMETEVHVENMGINLYSRPLFELSGYCCVSL